MLIVHLTTDWRPTYVSFKIVLHFFLLRAILFPCCTFHVLYPLCPAGNVFGLAYPYLYCSELAFTFSVH